MAVVLVNYCYNGLKRAFNSIALFLFNNVFMIRKAVFSYFNPQNSYDNKAGFNSFRDYLASQMLSVLMAGKHFEEVEIITDDWGVNLLKNKLRLPVQFSNKLNEIKGVNIAFWAYGKLMAYASQTKPFIHIDNDVYLLNPLPERLLNANLCFQSVEYFDRKGFAWYNELKKSWIESPVKPEIIENNEISDFAYNCGICGGSNLKHFKKLLECSKEYIFAPENQAIFFDKFKNILIHQNLFHEQYFNAVLAKANKLRDKVEVLANDVQDINKNGFRYVHLWGTSKKDKKLMAKLHGRLYKDFPEYYSILEKVKL